MDLPDIQSALIATYRKKRQKITCAESCTAGMVAAALTDLPGSSEIFDRGFVTYSNAAKLEMLGVLETTLDQHGAVSEQVAREMALGALQRSDADISIAVTGIAGPGGSDFKPEGRVCFARAQKNGTCESITKEFGPLGRRNVRSMSRNFALQLLLFDDRVPFPL